MPKTTNIQTEAKSEKKKKRRKIQKKNIMKDMWDGVHGFNTRIVEVTEKDGRDTGTEVITWDLCAKNFLKLMISNYPKGCRNVRQIKQLILLQWFSLFVWLFFFFYCAKGYFFSLLHNILTKTFYENTEVLLCIFIDSIDKSRRIIEGFKRICKHSSDGVELNWKLNIHLKLLSNICIS